MAASPKKAFLLIPAYICILLVCVVIGELAYMVYYNTTALIAGRQLQLFNTQALARGFFVVVPIVIFLSPVFFSFYRVRHSGGGFPPVLAYIVLCAATWCALYPAFIIFKSRAHRAGSSYSEPLTAGYFRPYSGTIVYLTRDLTASQNDAVVFNKSAAEDAITVGVVDKTNIENESAPFNDMLIRETVPLLPSWIVESFAALELRAEYAWKSGRVHWLCFLSFALALCCTYAVTFCSDWRLVNIIYLLVVNAGIFSFNVLYYSSYFTAFRNIGLSLEARVPFLSNVDGLSLVCVNISVALVCVAIGLLAMFARSKRLKRG